MASTETKNTGPLRNLPVYLKDDWIKVKSAFG
jgi:hypothetical protein